MRLALWPLGCALVIAVSGCHAPVRPTAVERHPAPPTLEQALELMRAQSEKRCFPERDLAACVVLIGMYEAPFRQRADATERQMVFEFAKRLAVTECLQRRQPDSCLVGAALLRGDLALDALPESLHERLRVLLETGCNSASGEACETLSEVVLKRDPAEAVRLLGRACELGRGDACQQAAWRDQADGDYSHAGARWLDRGCALGNLDACVEEAKLLATGRVVGADPPRAAALLQRACDGDQQVACGLLGHLYDRGAGVVRDRARAERLWKQSCGRKVASSCEALGRAHN